MLQLKADQLETLWDPLLPAGAGALSTAMTRLDELLSEPAFLEPFRSHWQLEAERRQRRLFDFGRPTIPMETYLRLMFIKQRTGWGYELLVQEVADSFHLRRFCHLDFAEPVPDESTVRKLTRRIGEPVVSDLIQAGIRIALETRKFRPRALRCDSTALAADIHFPTDAHLVADAVRTLARLARKVRAPLPDLEPRVRDRSRKVGQLLRSLGRALVRRTGTAKVAVEQVTTAAAAQLRLSLEEARQLLARAQSSTKVAVGVSDRAGERAIHELEECIALSERVAEQVRQRFAGEKIKDRLISLFDPDARVIRRGKLGTPNEFGYMVQLAEVTSHTRKGARGLIVPPQLRPGSTHDNTLLSDTVKWLVRLGLKLKEAAFDGGFGVHATAAQMAATGAAIFIAGQSFPDSRYTRRRLARYRVGCEGRISHLKREHGLQRTRLKGRPGAHIWASWSVLTYDLETIARMKVKTHGDEHGPSG